MDNFMFDTFGMGFEDYNPFSTGFPTPAQMNEAFPNLNSNLDVSGFGLAEWKQYDPYNLDIRNPYVGGYPTLGGDWDPLLDYDPYAPHIFENMNSLMNAQSQFDEMISSLPSAETDITATALPSDLTGCNMFRNPYLPEGYANSDQFLNDMLIQGKISQTDVDFLNMLFPKHHETVDFNHIESEPSIAQQKLDKSDFIERERDTAVEKYNDAKSAGNYEEMLKWETIANDKQQDLYYLWDTPQYGLPAKAPGIA